MARKRYSIEEIKNKLIDNGKDIILVGEYTSNNSKTKFKHTICGHEWLTSFAIVGRHGCGCPKCQIDKQRLTTAEINKRLSSKNITMVGNYFNSHTKIEFTHNFCGHQWEAKPCDLLNGDHGCPKCASHGFNKSKPSALYVLESNGYIKYGITNNLDQRLNAHRRNGDITLHFVKHHEDGKYIKQLENDIKQHFGGCYASREMCPDGHTETVSPSSLSNILNYLEDK